jgi:acyl dehydratase
MRSHRVAAHNTATASANKIHDDEVARRYGFGGGLVPGVDVYAYMTHVPAAEWGPDWLARGSMGARFLMPVYEGDVATVVPGDPVEVDGGPCVPLEVRNEAGATCAVGHAGLPAEPGAPPDVAEVSGVARPERPDADPASLAPGTALAVAPELWVAAGAGPYLADVREDLALYAAERVAHPAWVLRRANDVLGSNVRLGPWIHVESEVRHHAPVADGDAVDTRATVTREWEHKGHRFVELDVGVFASGRLAARIVHTAIYRPRQVAA